MMLEIVDPPVTYLRIIRAALIPAILYYLSLFLIAHFHARGIAIADTGRDGPAEASAANPLAESRHEGIVFATALGFLILLLILGYTLLHAVPGGDRVAGGYRRRRGVQRAHPPVRPGCREGLREVGARRRVARSRAIRFRGASAAADQPRLSPAPAGERSALALLGSPRRG